MTTKQKSQKLRKLAKCRQEDSLPPHACLADFHGGLYECDYVSPWSISACNVDAEVMIIGQDWASSDVLEQECDKKRQERQRTGQDSSSPTNKNLCEFLGYMGLGFSETYATNVFPFIKRGKKSDPIPCRDLVSCAETYALPQIEIVSPRMAICLGQRTFDAVCRAGGQDLRDWKRARSPGPHIRISSVKVYGLPHPAARIKKETKVDRWRRLGQHLQRMRDQDHHRS